MSRAAVRDEVEELYERAAARAELERRELTSKLQTYIPIANPAHRAPNALSGLYDVLDRIHAGEQIFAIVEGPPRTRKTTTVFHAVARRMQIRPQLKFGYGTYSSEVARQQSQRCRDMCEQAGVWVGEEQQTKSRFGVAKSMSYWATKAGGGGKFFGRGGGVIGSGFDFLFCDDPIKDWDEYGSPTKVESTWTWVLALLNRMEPGGSFLIGHHRWGDDDPIGRLKAQIESGYEDVPEEFRKDLAQIKWEIVTLRGVAYSVLPNGKQVPDFNRPLLTEEEGWFSKIELLRKFAASPEQFNPQIGQLTSKKGGQLFPDLWPVWNAETDERGDELGMSVGDVWMPVPNLTGKTLVFSGDTAGSEASTSDYTAIWLSAFEWRWSKELEQFEAWQYVIWVWYERWESPDVVDNVARICKTLPAAQFAYEVNSIGGAQFQFLKRDHPDIAVWPVRASKSKRARAIPMAGAAQRQRVLIPMRAPWLKEWRNQMKKFTGLGGAVKDDIPDAGVHGYNFFSSKTAPPMKSMSGAERSLRGRGTGSY